jgi:hypothetical protein
MYELAMIRPKTFQTVPQCVPCRDATVLLSYINEGMRYADCNVCETRRLTSTGGAYNMQYHHGSNVCLEIRNRKARSLAKEQALQQSRLQLIVICLSITGRQPFNLADALMSRLCVLWRAADALCGSIMHWLIYG